MCFNILQHFRGTSLGWHVFNLFRCFEYAILDSIAKVVFMLVANRCVPREGGRGTVDFLNSSATHCPWCFNDGQISDSFNYAVFSVSCLLMCVLTRLVWAWRACQATYRVCAIPQLPTFHSPTLRCLDNTVATPPPAALESPVPTSLQAFSFPLCWQRFFLLYNAFAVGSAMC